MDTTHLKIAGFLFLWLAFIQSGIARNEKSTSVANYSLKEMSITGHTNVNSFFLKYSGSDVVKSSASNNDVGDTGKRNLIISIPVKSFVFSNNLMRKDFFKMLKADEYTEIPIQLKEVKDLNGLKDNTQESVTVDITLAGVTKTVFLSCRISKMESGGYLLSGTKLLLLTDFDISPPSKFLGMVKVNNEIKIDFDFKLDLGNN